MAPFSEDEEILEAAVAGIPRIAEVVWPAPGSVDTRLS